LDAVLEVYGPAVFVAVDRHCDLGVARRMIERSPQYKKLGAELRDRQDVAVYV
jgi:hypothetical protein